jgi:hypothetical protein
MLSTRAAHVCLHTPRRSQILAQSLRVAGPLLLAATWLGCAGDESGVLTPSFHEGMHNISGRIFGPDGRNICRTVQEGTMLVRLLNPDFGSTPDAPVFLDEQDITCPDNAYSLTTGEHTAHLRVELPLNENLGTLPWRNLDQFALPAGGVHNVRIGNGSPLRGRARIDGNPFDGVFFDITPEFNTNYGIASGSSGADGRWMEFFGRSPTILQNDRRYFAFSSCGVTLGTRQRVGPPESPFTFPSGRDAMTCNLETSSATRFSHTFTRLVVTPFPGDIGGWFLSPLTEQYGIGWGVQFPIAPGSSPIHGIPDFSHMFNGGLLIGLGPDHVLAGFDAAGGGLQCGPTCHDLGLNGTVEFTPPGGMPTRRAVTWRYSDATSAEAAGLRVIQRSIDGARGHDYVLFRFRFRNTSNSILRFHAGFAGDWDIDLNAADDRGFTALGGRLMYQVSAEETGIHVGTMLLGDVPVTGNYFFLPEDFLSVSDQMRALRGQLRRTTAGPADLRYIQGAGPIRLRPQEAQDIWVVIVAGENRAQLLDNAAAARADVASRLNEPMAEDATSAFNPGPAIRRASARPFCKNCKRQ